ncbi:hypothetical protein OIU74_009239 [Salix koriyanagi]|uniref:Uncharacterized protein n=1 Tax=Salix koriyanagi TaxID=2511006 RepID=A0A9Q0TRU0_9ROSI|nr:hypothetical protein OIU74_009239 [Salix koriyanagi]
MSGPLDQQQQQQQEPPPMEGTQQAAYTTHTGYGSVGPVIAVLAVITILGVIAGMIGRVCSGRRILGHHGQYDFEGWVERKCSSCLDGHVAPPPTRPTDIPVAAPAVKEGPRETREEKQEQIQHKPLAGIHEISLNLLLIFITSSFENYLCRGNYVQLPEILLSHHRSSGYVGRRNPILEEEAISHGEHHHESGTRKDLKYRTDGS